MSDNIPLSSGGIYHDTAVYLVLRWGKEHNYRAECEDRAEQDRAINPFRPDAVLRLKGHNPKKIPTVYIEVQNKIDDVWYSKIQKAYDNKHLIIIPLDNLEFNNGLERVEIQIGEYLDIGTEYGVNKHVSDRGILHCPYCNAVLKNKWPHVYTCKKKPMELKP